MAIGNQNQSGFLNQVFAALEAGDVFINKNGIFIYNGTPGPGNTPIIWLTPPGVATDPFGNALPASGGIVSFSAPFFSELTSGALKFSDTSFPPTNAAQINLGAVGAATQELSLTSGNVSTDHPASMGLISSATPEILMSLNAVTILDLLAAGSTLNSLLKINGGLYLEEIAFPGSIGGFIYLYGDVTGDIHSQGSVFLDAGFMQFPANGSAPASVAAASRPYADTNGTFRVVDGNDGNAYCTERLTKRASGQTVNSVTLTSVTGIGSVALGVGTYHVMGRIKYTSSAVAGAAQMELVTTGTMSGDGFIKESIAGAAGANIGQYGAPALNAAFNGATLTSSTRQFEFDYIVTVTVAGNITPEVACTIAADTWTVTNGSYMTVEPL